MILLSDIQNVMQALISMLTTARELEKRKDVGYILLRAPASMLLEVLKHATINEDLSKEDYEVCERLFKNTYYIQDMKDCF